jgi:hypothetical protein
MNLVYKLDQNLDCNKICADIQKLLNKKMEQNQLVDCVLTIGINHIIDSHEKARTLLISYKESNHDAGENSN